MRKLTDVVTLWDCKGEEMSDVLRMMSEQAKVIEADYSLYCIDVSVEMAEDGDHWRGFMTTGNSEG